jgi:putative ABC transport system permease protein
MKQLRQIVGVSLMNLRSMPQRLATSAVTVIGISGVVAVLVSVLAMGSGINKTLQSAGRDDRVIVLRNGSTSETTSSLSRASALAIMDAAGVRRDAAGKPLASVELVRPVKVLTKSDNSAANAIFRGVGPQALRVRPEIVIIEGRMFRTSLNEVIVGKGAQAQFKGLNVGDTFDTRSATWTVVGVFTSNGDSHESELLTDVETLMSAYKRTNYSSMTASLTSTGAFREFKDAISTNPALAVDVDREKEYLARQSATVTQLLSVVAYVIGSIMALGATLGALNTMYSAVSTRAKQRATLRAMGFGGGAMVTSVLVEALLLSLVGGMVGAALAWVFFNGNSLSTAAGGSASTQLVFDVVVSPQLVALGLAWAVGIGIVGGLLPALRAARLPIATALKAM